MLFLAPVMISAAALPPWRTLLLGVLAMAAADAARFVHRPLPWAPGEPLALPSSTGSGIWFALAARPRLHRRLCLARRPRRRASSPRRWPPPNWSSPASSTSPQLDGLAAAAAHELGTPLATIALVAKELRRSGPQDGPDGRGRRRCSASRWTAAAASWASSRRSANESQGPLETMRLGLLLEEVAGPQRPFDVDIAVTHGRARAPSRSAAATPASSTASATSWRTPSTSPAERVVIAARWDADEVARHDPRRRAGLPARGPGPARRALRDDARRRRRDGRKEPGRAWASVCSSPRRCWSDRARVSISAMRRMVRPAPSCGWSGRGGLRKGAVARAEPLEPAFPL